MSNEFLHTELNTSDVAAAKKFYAALFDWKLSDQSMGPGMIYTMINSGGKGIGGIQKMPMPNTPSMWLPYVQVDNLDHSVGLAKKHGAHIIQARMDIGPNGSIAIIADPTGAVVGLWQAGPGTPAPKKAAKKPAAKKAAAKKPAAKKAPAKKKR